MKFSFSSPYYRRFTFLVISLSIVVALVYAFLPSVRKILISENHILETSTAFLYVWAWLLSVRNARRLSRGEIRNIALGIGLVSVVSFLEEINYGIYFIRNFYYFPTPKFYGHKFDALHDLLAIGFKGFQVESGLPYYWLIVVIGGVMGLGIVGVVVWKKDHLLYVVACFKRHPPLGFVGIWVVLLAVANVHDNFVHSSHDTYDVGELVEELFEMLGALALVFAGLLMRGTLNSGLSEGNHKKGEMIMERTMESS